MAIHFDKIDLYIFSSFMNNIDINLLIEPTQCVSAGRASGRQQQALLRPHHVAESDAGIVFQGRNKH